MPGPGDRPLHIGLLSPALPSKGLSNGIATYVRVMRDAFRSLGHLVTLADPDQIEFSDSTVADLPMSRGLKSRAEMLVEAWRGRDASTAYVRLRYLAAFQALKEAGAEIVEVEESWGWASRIAGRGIPIVMRLHGPHAFARESQARNRIDRRREAAELRAFRRVQAVSSPSSSVLQAMLDQGGQTQLARVIRNPVPLPGARWSLEKADPDQILFVGRFDLLKGADVVIRAFAAALEKRDSLKLVMVGPDRGLGGTVRFEQFVQGIPPKARQNIVFAGELPPDRVTRLRLQSALAVVASRYETFPYTAFEAQALGMPLLMTDTFGPRGIIADGLEGRIVPVDDPVAMGRAIVEMIDDRPALARMAAAGRKMVAEKMDPLSIARQTTAFYRQALQRTGDSDFAVGATGFAATRAP